MFFLLNNLYIKRSRKRLYTWMRSSTSLSIWFLVCCFLTVYNSSTASMSPAPRTCLSTVTSLSSCSAVSLLNRRSNTASFALWNGQFCNDSQHLWNATLLKSPVLLGLLLALRGCSKSNPSIIKVLPENVSRSRTSKKIPHTEDTNSLDRCG